MNEEIEKGHTLVVDYGIYNHFGIADGMGFVYENSKNMGCRTKVSLEDFSGGKEIKNIGILGDLTPNEIICNAQSLIKNNKNYQLMLNNCEHFIREVCGVDIKSPQIQTKLMSTSFFALAYYTKNPIVRGASIGAGLATAFTKNEEDIVKNTITFALVGAVSVWLLKK